MESKRVIKNAGWIIGCKIVKAVLSVIVTMFTARFLGPSNYGLINYAASLTTFASSLMYLGINSTLVYEFVDDKENDGKVLGTAMGLCLTSSILCVVGVISFSLIANSGEQETIIVCALYSVLLFFQALEIVQYWFQYKLKSKYVSITMLISYVILASFQLLLLATKQNIYWFAISYSLDYFLISLFLIIFYKRNGGGAFSFSFQKAKKILSRSKYYIIASLMVTIYSQTDKVMIKMMLGNDATGFYSAALVCATSFSFVFAAIIDSFRPVIFENKKNSEDAFKSSMKRLYSLVIYLSLLLCLLMTIFAPFVIRVLYGSEYGDSINPLRIVVWFSTFSYLGTIRNIWMLAENKQKYIWIINLFGAAANIGLNFAFIPLMGINGAALASLLTQFLTNVIIGFIFKPIIGNNLLMLGGTNPLVLKDTFKIVLKSFRKKNENCSTNSDI